MCACSVAWDCLWLQGLWLIPLSMGFPWQEHWSGLLFPAPEDLLKMGIDLSLLGLLCLLFSRFFTTEPPGNPLTWALTPICHTIRCCFSNIFFTSSVQFSSVLSRVWLCDPTNCSMPGLPVHHQLPEFTQTHVHWVGGVIQPSHPLSSPSPPALNLSHHQDLFKWVSSSHQMAKLLEF